MITVFEASFVTTLSVLVLAGAVEIFDFGSVTVLVVAGVTVFFAFGSADFPEAGASFFFLRRFYISFVFFILFY